MSLRLDQNVPLTALASFAGAWRKLASGDLSHLVFFAQSTISATRFDDNVPFPQCFFNRSVNGVSTCSSSTVVAASRRRMPPRNPLVCSAGTDDALPVQSAGGSSRGSTPAANRLRREPFGAMLDEHKNIARRKRISNKKASDSHLANLSQNGCDHPAIRKPW